MGLVAPEPPGRSGPLTNIALSWMRITSRRGPPSARVSDGRRVLRQKQPVGEEIPPRNHDPEGVSRNSSRLGPRAATVSASAATYCARRSSRCAQLPARDGYSHGSSPGKARGRAPTRTTTAEMPLRRGVPDDTCRLARRPIAHRRIGTRGRNCGRRRPGPCSSTQSVDTSVKSVIGLRHQPVWSPPPCCSGHGRELPHLARPQPVRRPDLAHVNLGGGNAMPRQQIDKLASQPLNVA